MTWNHDMAKAPRGTFRVVPAGKDAKSARKVFERAEIIIAGKCGVVCVSYFIPDEKRWNMLAAGEQPVAWLPVTEMRTEMVDGKTRQVLPAHPTMATSWFADMLAARRAA